MHTRQLPSLSDSGEGGRRLQRMHCVLRAKLCLPQPVQSQSPALRSMGGRAEDGRTALHRKHRSRNAKFSEWQDEHDQSPGRDILGGFA